MDGKGVEDFARSSVDVKEVEDFVEVEEVKEQF